MSSMDLKFAVDATLAVPSWLSLRQYCLKIGKDQ